MNEFLVGDIGGTKTRLAVVTVVGTQVQIMCEATYASRDYASLEILLSDFLTNKQTFHCAVFGIAGPVQGRRVKTTNLPWHIDADVLQKKLGIVQCVLLNDLEVIAYGLPSLGLDDVQLLQKGAPNAVGNVAVIAAGTGLGEAALFWDGQRHQPFATEGGHTSFSPGNELEGQFLQYMQKKYTHVSWERVVSGMGVLNLHAFLRLHRQTEIPAWLAEEMHAGDAAAAIADAALSGRDEICLETMSWFARLYGAEAGNLALKVMSRGGIYLAGGIAPKILPLLQTGAFLDAFQQKGRMQPLLEAMPVNVILDNRIALSGAALRAAHLSDEA